MRFYTCFFLIPCLTHAMLLDKEVEQNLSYCNIQLNSPQEIDFLDVAIIGAGHAGKGLYLALQKQGIRNIAIFDSEAKGQESIWFTTARMKTLRSEKNCVGPALSVPNLTFRAWYEAQGNNWNEIVKIPTDLWGHYLHWFEEVLHLPIFYEWKLTSIKPEQKNHLQLTFNQNRTIHARKVILATGRNSFGGPMIPPLVQKLPKSLWHHSSEKIDSSLFAKKRICIIGASSSAFDLAARALEEGALHVDMLMRRDVVKTTNYLFLHFKDWLAYYHLSDEKKIDLIHNAFQYGFCPPLEAIEQVIPHANFHLHSKTVVENFSWTIDNITVHTNQGDFQEDLLFVATGFKCDPFLVPIINSFADKILLWKNKIESIPDYLSLFPYLGKGFEFMEKTTGSNPFLKNIHCFNFGSYLSHGNTGIDIDQFHIGAERLAESIAIDFALDLDFHSN